MNNDCMIVSMREVLFNVFSIMCTAQNGWRFCIDSTTQVLYSNAHFWDPFLLNSDQKVYKH